MWHEKHNKMIFPGQMMGPPLRPQAPHMENVILPPPSHVSDTDLLSESSRKRKATALDQQGSSISESVLEYCLPRELNANHKIGALAGSNVQGNTLFSNQTPHPGVPNTKLHQFGKYPFRSLNSFSASWQTNDASFSKSAVEKMNNSYLNVLPQAFQRKGPFLLSDSPGREIIAAPYQQPLSYDMFIQTEAHKFLVSRDSNNVGTDNAHGSCGVKDGITFEYRNDIVAGNSPLELQNTSSESLSYSAASEIITAPYQQPLSYDMFIKTDAYKFLRSRDPNNAGVDNTHVSSGVQDGMNFEYRNHIVTANSPLQLQNTSSESLSSSEASLQRRTKNVDSSHCLAMDIRVHGQDVNKFGASIEMEQRGETSDVLGSKDTSSIETNSMGTSACTEEKKNGQSSQNSNSEVGAGCSYDAGLGANLKEKDRSLGDHNITTMMRPEGSNLENVKQLLEVKNLFSVEKTDNLANTPVGKGYGDAQQHDSLNLDGQIKCHSGKVTSTVIEKLWEGSLQLNASATVTAVAFFKSGEKVPEVNWSKSVEIKGKVRLEAFEKFIQELPRSRNRALMVISLCWKVGSSKTGLKGMKEVSKSYKVGEKVGFAQLSPGFDLYVCPRSDTIITILAKYGFFKGMAALEDDQDSLIGCVVWRRNRTSSNSVSKKPDRKNLSQSEQPLNSLSDPAILQSAESNSLLTQPAQGVSPLGIETRCVSLENVESNTAESNNIQSTKVEFKHGIATACATENSLPNNSPDVSVEVQSAPCSSSTQDPMRRLFEVEIPLVCCPEPEKSRARLELLKPVLPMPSQVENSLVCSSEAEKSHASLELLRSVLSIPSQVEIPLLCSSEQQKPRASLGLPRPVLPIPSQVLKQQHRPLASDDDDLPEFDFRTACGVTLSPASKHLLPSNNSSILGAAPFGKNLPTGRIRNVDRCMLPVLPIIQPVTVISQQRSQNPTFPGVALDTNQEISSRITPGEHEYQELMLPLLERRPILHSSKPLKQTSTVKPASGTSIPLSKNLWDDDDDMPEWCPPDLEHRNQSPPVATIRPSIPCIPSIIPNATLEKVPPGPPFPLVPCPSQVHIRPPLFSQGLSHGYQQCPMTISVKSAQPRPVGDYIQVGPRPSLGFNSNPMLRSQSHTFDVKPPIRPSLGFNSNPTLKPQSHTFEVKPSIRPSGWRGWKP